MKTKMIKTISIITMSLLLSVSAVGCTKTQVGSGNAATTQTASTKATTSQTSTAEASVLDTSKLFSDRDLEQLVDSTAATKIKLESGKDVTLNKEGIYVLSGDVKNVTVVVEAAEDASLGYIYIKNGTLNITAANDAIRANSLVQIDGGNINIKTCEEGIEANNIKINGGEITLYAKNDGINAAPKVNNNVAIEVNGGTINVKMGVGDTDAFDANGNITINGGTIAVEATSAFDSDGTAALNGGNVTVNGQKITQITQQQMGGKGGKRK